MKTYYFSKGKFPFLFLLGMLAISITSCKSYQNTPTDNDGIYGNNSNRRVYNDSPNAQNLEYQDYFASLSDSEQEAEVFTDVENYQSASSNNGEYATGNAGWGANSDNITINVYDNNWRYGMWNNYWYGSGWGWAYGWGYSPWYGPGWGIGYNNYWYNPYYGYGWNSWYGPHYGYPIYNSYYNTYYNNYSNNTGIRGVRNDMYGRTSTSRNATSRANTTTRNTATRATRADNTIRSTRNTVPNSTRRYDVNRSTRQSNSNTRSTPVRTAPNNRARSYDSAPARTQRQAPAPTPNYNMQRSTAPTSPSINSGSSRSSGNMGGSSRSSNSGGRR